MTPTTPRAPRRLLCRLALISLIVSAVTTGVVSPAPAQSGRPIVESRVHALSEAAARAGFTRTVETDLPTQLVGFEWEGRTEGAVEVRVRDREGSQWVTVHGDPNEGPDRGSPEFRNRTTAGPVWVGPTTRQVEVRVVEGELPKLKLHAIRSEDPPAGRGGLRPAGAAVAQPGIISRASWGADESFRTVGPGCTGQVEINGVRFAVIHHTAGSNAYNPGDSAAIVRGIYQFHTHTNGWCDIGYNFLVDKYGQIFEGRWGGPTQSIVGAHAEGYNYGSTGVAVIGHFQNDPVPGPAYSSLKTLLAWKLELHGVNPQGFAQQNGRVIPNIIGHRDANATECPGTQLYNLIPQLRTELGGGSTAPRIRWVALHSAKSIDISGGSHANGATVLQWTSHGGANQQYYVEPLANGAYRIVAAHSGKTLDVAGGSTADGAVVTQWDWHGGPNQQWRLESLGGDDFRIVSVHSGKALDVAGGSTADGARIIQWAAHGGNNQRWRRVPA